MLGDDEGMTTIDEILASLGPDPQAGGTPMQSLVLSHAQQRAIERSLQMTDPSPAAGAIPDYIGSADLHFGLDERYAYERWRKVINVACKPLYDRITELEAENEQLRSVALDSMPGRRIDRYQRDLAAIEEYMVANKLVTTRHIGFVLDMVRAAQRGDTDAHQ